MYSRNVLARSRTKSDARAIQRQLRGYGSSVFLRRSPSRPERWDVWVSFPLARAVVAHQEV